MNALVLRAAAVAVVLSAVDKRWDLQPGRGVFTRWINVTDMTALIAGPSGYPPMFGGARAFNGPACPWAP